MFLVFINDVTNSLRSNSKLFADDVMTFNTAYDTYKAADDINHNLNLVNLWARK